METYFVKIRTPTWERLRDLQEVYDLDVFHQTAKRLVEGRFEIEGLLDDAQIERLQGDGFEVEITADAGQVAKERLHDVGRTSHGAG